MKFTSHLKLGSVVAGLTLSLAASAVATSDGWITDLATAKKQAAESKRDIFMNFTGSDW
jgi:hypothetical protein